MARKLTNKEKWAVYSEGQIFGFFETEWHAEQFAKSELPNAFANGIVRIGKLYEV